MDEQLAATFSMYKHTLTRLWCQQQPKFADKPGPWSFAPPWFSPACQRSCSFPTGYLPRSRFSSKQGWNVALEASESPTTFTCMLICIRAWPAFIGVSLQQASPARDLPGQGVNHHVTHLGQLSVVVSFSAANATRCKKSDACSLMHYDRHWLRSDTRDIGRFSPTFL